MWKTIYLLYLFLFQFISITGDDNLVFIILSQSNKFHNNLAEQLKENLLIGNYFVEKKPPIVHLSHIDFPHIGSWTVLPLLPQLATNHGSNSSWHVFLHGNAHVNKDKLYTTLKKYDAQKEIWLGYAVYDQEPSRIHHFAFSESESEKYMYPVSSPGFAISTPLVRRLAEQFINTSELKDTFSIDFAYELSSFIWNEGNGPKITHEPTFCPFKDNGCSTYPINLYPCREPISKDSIFFAVKTFSGFHDSRLLVIKDTWAKHTPNVVFFSDVEDKTLGTISLGIPNAERGHCAKTMAMIKYGSDLMTNSSKYKWIFVVDDDTILSVRRTREILSCYDHNDDIALGERYGYRVVSGEGYNYLTGGAGFILSKALVKKLINMKRCRCPDISSPDDMFLGACLGNMGIDLVHSPEFHQARPSDYPPEYLQGHIPVSFHKYWMIDPRVVYKEWFSALDDKPDFPLQDEL